MRQGLFDSQSVYGARGAGFFVMSNTPFLLADGSVTNVLRTRTGSVNQDLNPCSGDTEMAAAKSKSSKSSGKGKTGGKGPGKVSPPAIMMANLKGKKSK